MLNKVILMGRLTRDPEIKQTQNGKTMLKFTVAVDRGSGDAKQTDFISCVAWEKRAEFIAKYFGNGTTVFTTDVWVDEASFTGEKKADRVQAGSPPVPASEPEFPEDGLPF